MRLARHVLDKEILDRDGSKGGKVDDLLLELRDGECPVVRALVTQNGALAGRLGGVAAAASRWLRRAVLGFGPEHPPVQIGWEHVTRIDVTVHIDLDRASAQLISAEDALWQRWLKHLPTVQ